MSYFKRYLSIIFAFLLLISGCSLKKEPTQKTGIQIKPTPTLIKSTPSITKSSPSVKISDQEDYEKELIPSESWIRDNYLFINTNIEKDQKKNYDKFIKALKDADFKKAKSYLEKHPVHVNSPGEHYMTPIQWAAENNRLDVVKFLLENEAFINVRGRFFLPPEPIFLAAAKGNDKIVAFLIKKGADTSYPLKRAVMERNKKAILTLINNGVKFHEWNLEQITSIDHSGPASQKYREDYEKLSEGEIIDLMLMEKYWGDSSTPLHYARKEIWGDKQYLIEKRLKKKDSPPPRSPLPPR